MATYWEGSKQISKAQYDATQAKHAAWTGPKVVDAPTPTRQPSGKQPVSAPVDSSWSAWQKIKEGLVAAGKQPVPVASTDPLGIIDVRKNLEDYLKSPEGIAAAEEAKRLFSGSSGKQPVDTSALNALDQDTLRRLQEEADRKRMEEQLAAAATHGKEIVFEFSKPISSKANTYVSKLVKLLGGKRSYIENQTKLVVVM
jgi:hypothetical protein